ncbi:hypothetical protein KJ909_04140 [Patescibacteria group bacterium]|nr:hypothetical protein [Patescibacteria group bacterium]
MIRFDPRYFVTFNFSDNQVILYLNNALRDLTIAKENKRPEVKFSYSYNALIKAGIALLAGAGNVKVRSIPGHHVKLIEKMSEVLKDKSIEETGNAMRAKRNRDFYDGGVFISEKESLDYYMFTEEILLKIKRFLRQKEAR